jgi:hypothetical protein
VKEAKAVSVEDFIATTGLEGSSAENMIKFYVFSALSVIAGGILFFIFAFKFHKKRTGLGSFDTEGIEKQ